MEVFKIKGVHIDGVVACVPENRNDNETSLREMYGDEAKLIMESTGIRTRYLANPGTSSADLCLKCAEELLKCPLLTYVSFATSVNMPLF